MNALDFIPDINPEVELECVYVLNESAVVHSNGIDFDALKHPTEKRIIPVYKGTQYIMMMPIGIAFMKGKKEYRLLYSFNDMISAYNQAIREGVTPYVTDANGMEVVFKKNYEGADCMLPTYEPSDGIMITSTKVFDSAYYPRVGVIPKIAVSVSDATPLDGSKPNTYAVNKEINPSFIEGYATNNLGSLEGKVLSNHNKVCSFVLDILREVPRVKDSLKARQDLHYAFNYEYADDIKNLITLDLYPSNLENVLKEPQSLTFFIEGLIIKIDVSYNSYKE